MQETGKYNFNEAIALYKHGQWIYPAAVNVSQGCPTKLSPTNCSHLLAQAAPTSISNARARIAVQFLPQSSP